VEHRKTAGSPWLTSPRQGPGFLSTDWKQEHELLYLYQRSMQLDGTRFRRAFGRLPATPYREGVKRTMAWWKVRLEGR